MTYSIHWNPGPIVTHLVDESSPDVKTLCGVRITEGWESGEDYEAGELGSAYVGCHRCTRIADRIAKEAKP